MKNDTTIKILIIEDEAPVRMSMAAYLEDHGYKILEAENGRAGLEVFRREIPDLVLVDLRMPEVDGLEVLASVTEESPDTPIIVVSGTGVIGDAIEALRLGAWDYVLKPISDMEVLLHALQNALEKLRLLAENKMHQERLEDLVKKRTAKLEEEIEERKRTEKALRESEERYRTLIDMAREGVWKIDAEMRTTFVNRQMADMLGYRVEEMVDRTIPEFLDEENAAMFRQRFERRKEGHGEQYDIKFCCKDGSEVWGIVNANPLFDFEGKVVGAFAMVTDVTKRKLAEEAIKEREESYRTLSENLPGMVYRLFPEENNRMEFFNDMLETMTGYQVEELIHDEVCNIDNLILPEDRPLTKQTVKDAVWKDRAFEIEYRIKHKEGGVKYFLERGRPLHDVDGKVLYIDGVILDQTDRKQAEQTLQVEREQLLSIFNSINEIIYVSDPETYEILYANDFLIETFKKNPVGGICYQVFQGLDSPCDFCTNEIILKNKYQPYQWEYHNPVLNRDYMITDRIIKWSDGRDVRFEIAIDITDRKLMEEELLKEKKFSDLVLNSLPGIFFLIDENKNLNRWNKNLDVVSGYSANEIRRMKPTDFFAQGEKERVSQRIREAFTTGKSELEASLITKDNSKIPHYFTGYRIVIDGKKYILGVGIDISDQKQAEEKLRESEKRYRAVVEDMPAMICRFTRDGVLTFINSAYCKYFNKKPEELIGQNFFQFIPVEDQEKVRDHFMSLDQNMPMTTYEHKVIAPEGKIQWQEWTDRALFDESGHVSEYQSIGRDITEVKLAQDERNKIQKQLQQSQKMEAIGTLAGGIAHDFNNILAPIIICSEMLLEDVSTDTFLHENLQAILNAGLRAKDLVQQILTFSRQTDQDFKPLRIQTIIKEVLKLSRSTLPTTIQIQQQISNQCGLVMADPTQIHQIAMNLITNAYHAMEETGGNLNITLEEVELTVDDLKDPEMIPGPYVCLAIADTGIGMERFVMERIFEPYFTTKDKGKGTGMGLSVVHGIVKGLGGDIRVYSEPGKGTSFQVYLPVFKTKIEALETEVMEAVVGGTERILFVDDEDQIVRMVKLILERLGYQVTTRTGSIDALGLFQVSPDKFDLVITDMTMPNMTGVQLAKKLLAIRSDIPIIICSGFSEIMDEQKAKELGIRGYVMKPVVKKELAKKIREVLDS